MKDLGRGSAVRRLASDAGTEQAHGAEPDTPHLTSCELNLAVSHEAGAPGPDGKRSRASARRVRSSRASGGHSAESCVGECGGAMMRPSTAPRNGALPLVTWEERVKVGDGVAETVKGQWRRGDVLVRHRRVEQHDDRRERWSCSHGRRPSSRSLTPTTLFPTTSEYPVVNDVLSDRLPGAGEPCGPDGQLPQRLLYALGQRVERPPSPISSVGCSTAHIAVPSSRWTCLATRLAATGSWRGDRTATSGSTNYGTTSERRLAASLREN